jgi:hypothetical protein
MTDDCRAAYGRETQPGDEPDELEVVYNAFYSEEDYSDEQEFYEAVDEWYEDEDADDWADIDEAQLADERGSAGDE